MCSCTLYKKPNIPFLNNPLHFKPKIKMTSLNLKDQWWENFHDKKLNKLVYLAIKNNYSYQVALKNIEIACTYVSQNLSNLYPQINLGFNSSRNKSASTIINNLSGGTATINPASTSFSRIYNLQELTGSVSYQIDAWNQVRNSVKQAEANQAVSEADSKSTKLTIISSVVTTYFQIKALNDNLINLNMQQKTEEEIIRLYHTQYQSGLIDFSILDNTRNQLEIIKTNIDTLKKQIKILQFTLAYLSGEYPETFNLKIDNGFKNFHSINLIPPGIPAKMIANRPDIQNAYYQILSYGYLEKQTIANFLPSLSLTGDDGYASTSLSHLISSANTYWSAGFFAMQYVFDYATRMSEYQRAKFQYQSAILNYRNTVINAYKEVDSALISYKEDNEALHSYQKQKINSNDLFMLANSQYQSGLADYNAYLASRLAYLQSDYNLTNQKLSVVQDVIQVYASLGLGL
jgi:multidrug efflux system outer membrane protein